MDEPGRRSSLLLAGQLEAILPRLGKPAKPEASALAHPRVDLAAMAGRPGTTRYWQAVVAADATPVILWDSPRLAELLGAEPAPPLDFVASDDPDAPLDPRATFVPEAAIRAMLEPLAASVAALVERLSDAGVADVAVLGTRLPDVPPPERALPDASMTDIERDAPPIPRGAFREKVWRLAQTTIRDAAAAAGARFVASPAEPLDPDAWIERMADAASPARPADAEAA